MATASSDFASLLEREAPRSLEFASEVSVRDGYGQLHVWLTDGSRCARVARSGTLFSVRIDTAYWTAFIDEDSEGEDLVEVVRELVDVTVQYLSHGAVAKRSRWLKRPYVVVPTERGEFRMHPGPACEPPVL